MRPAVSWRPPPEPGCQWPGGAKPIRATSSQPPIQLVPSVDLARYAGKWYEIARLPNRFERDCIANATATYTLRPDGKITVINECRGEDGRIKSANSVARVSDPKEPNTKLKVSFFWPFSGNYCTGGRARPRLPLDS